MQPSDSSSRSNAKTWGVIEIGSGPVEFSIGKPSPLAVRTELDTVKRHVQAWLYVRLLNEPLGRLEQEFLSTASVHRTLREWTQSQSPST